MNRTQHDGQVGFWSDVANATPTAQFPGPNTTLDENSQGCGASPAPSTYWFLNNLTAKHFSLLVVYVLCTVITVALYVDETVFILKFFKSNKTRSNKTIWVLAVFPVFSLTGLLGYLIPLSAPILDLVSNTFMATCLYNMLELMMNYLGGHDRLWSVVREGQLTVHFATLPVCCLVPCLPTRRLDRVLLKRLRIAVLQVCIVRPIIMFIAAIMWANGTYNHSGLDFKTGDPYIAIVNATTTIIAVFGLNLCKTAFVDPLKKYLLGGKIFILQMVLATCSLAPGFTKLFWKWGLVKCDAIYLPPVHLDAIYRGVLVTSMLIYSVVAHFLFRRQTDASVDIERYDVDPDPELNLKDRLCFYIAGPRRFLNTFRAWAKRRQGGTTDGVELECNEIYSNAMHRTILEDESPPSDGPTRKHNLCNGFLQDDVNQNGTSIPFIDDHDPHPEDMSSTMLPLKSYETYNSTSSNSEIDISQIIVVSGAKDCIA